MDWLSAIDHRTLFWPKTLWPYQGLTSFMIDVSALGGRAVLTLVVLFAVGLLLCLRRYRTAGFVLAAALGGVLLSCTIKTAIGGPGRPTIIPWCRLPTRWRASLGAARRTPRCGPGRSVAVRGQS
jgi:hypothetical protein